MLRRRRLMAALHAMIISRRRLLLVVIMFGWRYLFVTSSITNVWWMPNTVCSPANAAADDTADAAAATTPANAAGAGFHER